MSWTEQKPCLLYFYLKTWRSDTTAVVKLATTNSSGGGIFFFFFRTDRKWHNHTSLCFYFSRIAHFFQFSCNRFFFFFFEVLSVDFILECLGVATWTGY